MKLGPLPVVVLSLAFVSSGCIFTLGAQEASAPSKAETDRCVRWMKAMGPGHSPDLADFCLGIQRRGVGGWWSLWKCGDPAEQLPGTAPGYCTSSGQITEHEAWAAGFSGMSRDGHEFLDEVSDTTKDSRLVAAVFYSRTAVWMGNLRVPAGMYDLVPSKSPEGWRVAVAKQDGESPRYLGSVDLKSAATDDTVTHLGVSTKPWAEGCGGPSPDFSVRELHFVYGNNDLFVCIRPDQAPVSLQENISQAN